MKRDRLVKGMIGLAAAVFIAIPAGLSHQSVLAADTEKGVTLKSEAQSEALEEYDLVVIQEEPVPLAPFADKNYDLIVVLVVFLSLIVLLSVGYCLWYLSCRRRIWALSVNLPADEAEKARGDTTIFHPLRTARAEREIENRIASEFVKT